MAKDDDVMVYCPECKAAKKLVKVMGEYNVLTCHTVLRENRGPAVIQETHP